MMDIMTLLNWITICVLGMMMIVRESCCFNDMDYLRKYGYLEPSDGRSDNLITNEYHKQAILKFQSMAGIPVTGIIDEDTRKAMLLPRCGVKDNIGTGDRARKKRYALHGSSWKQREILYRIKQYSRKVTIQEAQTELQRAFDLWSEVIPLKFVRSDYGPVDIEIKFVKGHHRDNTPFDGSGQTLAHAYFPQYGGDAHFDEDEKWTVNVADGVNLYQVAAHEFGHSLGLAHSEVPSALMAPFYRGYDKNFKLDPDDIKAVQELYGRKDQEITTRVQYITTPKPTVRNDLTSSVVVPYICRNATIDAVTRTDDGITYMFKDEHYYRLNEHVAGIHQDYPRLIHKDWGGVKGPIDAALSWPNGWTFIFKGPHYWKFRNQQLIYGPKNISEGFDGIPDNIDTAFVWSGNGKTYFVKDDKYWRYHGNRIDYGYPRILKIWRGLPARLNAAFQWQNSRTYFFSKDQYYRYNDLTFNVDSGGYPKDTSVWWLGCPSKSQVVAFDKHVRNSMQDSSYGVDGNIYNGNNGGQDEQWITINDPHKTSGFHDYSGSDAKNSFQDGVDSGTVIPRLNIETFITLYITCIIIKFIHLH
ncbi:peptidase M10A [Mactra antiquata]